MFPVRPTTARRRYESMRLAQRSETAPDCLRRGEGGRDYPNRTGSSSDRPFLPPGTGTTAARPASARRAGSEHAVSTTPQRREELVSLHGSLHSPARAGRCQMMKIIGNNPPSADVYGGTGSPASSCGMGNHTAPAPLLRRPAPVSAASLWAGDKSRDLGINRRRDGSRND